MTTTEQTPAAADIANDLVESRMLFLQKEASALMSYFTDRDVSADDAVTIMAIVQTRVCASLGETRDAGFAGMQAMVAGLFAASKQDFDQKPTTESAEGEVKR